MFLNYKKIKWAWNNLSGSRILSLLIELQNRPSLFLVCLCLWYAVTGGNSMMVRTWLIVNIWKKFYSNHIICQRKLSKFNHPNLGVFCLLWRWTPARKWLHPDQWEVPTVSRKTCYTLWFSPLWRRIHTLAGWWPQANLKALQELAYWKTK